MRIARFCQAATHQSAKSQRLRAPDLNPRASAASNSPATLLGVAVVCIPHLVRADLMERTAPPKRSVLLRKRSSVQYCGQVVTRGRARKPGGTPQSGEKFAERDEPSIISKRRMGSISMIRSRPQLRSRESVPAKAISARIVQALRFDPGLVQSGESLESVFFG